MAIFPIRNVVLPAVLISSTIFSALTLPFVVIKSERPVTIDIPLLPEPLILEPPPLLKNEAQPILKSENRDVAIRYVGGVIVISVSAGIVTIELLRRLHASRRLVEPQYALPRLQSDPKLESNLPVDQFSVEMLEENTGSLEADSFLPETNHSPLALKTDTKPIVQDLGSVHIPVLESDQQYETCRIRVPHLERRLFAILCQGEYYSYLKTLKTREKALDVAAKLDQEREKAVITSTAQGYVVWVWQPEAFLDLVS